MSQPNENGRVTDALREIDDHGTLEGVPEGMADHLIVTGWVRWDGRDWVISPKAKFRIGREHE